VTFARRSLGNASNVLPIRPASPPRVVDPDEREAHRQFVQLHAELGVTQLELSQMIKRGTSTIERYTSGATQPPAFILIRMRRLIAERAGSQAA
jgi:hypothetical protein